MFLYPVGFPVGKYGCRVAVADRLPPRRNKCAVRWTGWYNEVDASRTEIHAGLRVLFTSYLDAAAQLMELDASAREEAILQLERKVRAAVTEARTEAEEAPACDVRPL